MRLGLGERRVDAYLVDVRVRRCRGVVRVVEGVRTLVERFEGPSRM